MRLPLVLAALSLATTGTAQERPKPPYWASISAGKARMRTGPARTYPASWLYQRADLPVRVTAVFKEWRKVRDPDGTEGWMLGNLISSTRTGIVRGTEPVPLRDRPTTTAKLVWRAAPGVVGRLTQCGGGWCRLDVKGQAGFVEVGALWGVEADERLP
jgi:SH3-like domain-containing protein